MVADSALPVWTFQPTWADGIRETLEWKTDVLGVIYEQRRAIRLTPRRSFEFDLIAENEARTRLILMLHRLGASEFMFPLWIDNVRLGNTSAGTDRLDFDTRWTEFAPGLAILIGKGPFDYEVVEIISVDDAGVDLADPTTKDFDGCRVYPLLRGQLEEQQSVQRTLQRLGQATLRFNVTKANPRTVPAESPTLYLSDPVLEEWPDERESLTYEFGRSSFTVDSGYGLPYTVDEGQRAFVAESYGWYLDGKQKQAAFRDMLYRLRGRQVARWIPSFAADARLADNAALGANAIHVKECGLAYVGGPFSGRQDIRIEQTNGSVSYHRILTAGLLSEGRENWTISPVLPAALTPATVARITFIDIGRLDTDSIEIVHLTNTVATAKSAFRTIKSGRTAPEPIDLPIPTSLTSLDACGEFVGVGSPAVSEVEGDADGDGLEQEEGDEYDTIGGPSDGSLPDDPVTGSTYAGIVFRMVTSTGSGPFGTATTPGDIDGGEHRLYVPSSLARDHLLVDFPALASLPWSVTNIYTISDETGLGANGPLWDYSGGDWVWYNNYSLDPAQDMWGGQGGYYTEWNDYPEDQNDPNAYLSAMGGPFTMSDTYYDDAHTIRKERIGKGVVLAFHDFGGVNPDQGPVVSPDTITPSWGRGNYTLWSFDYHKYYAASRD